MIISVPKPLIHTSNHSCRKMTKMTCTVPKGTYVKNLKKSDMNSYGKMLGMLQLGPLQRFSAIELIEGISVEIQDKEVILSFLTVVPFLQITERYNLGDEKGTRNSRRDLRSGDMFCKAQVVKECTEDGHQSEILRLESSWKDPLGGKLVEKMFVTEEKELVVLSSLAVKEGSMTARQVCSECCSEKRLHPCYHGMTRDCVEVQIYEPVSLWRPKHSWDPVKAMQIMTRGRA